MQTIHQFITNCKYILFVIAALLLTVQFMPRFTYAQEECTEAKLRDLQVSIINCTGDQGTTTQCQSTGPSNRSLYMIGDSITEGSLFDLQAAFGAAGYVHTIDGVASRSLTSGTALTNGQTILENSSSSYATSGVIVVALGTNGGLTDANIKAAINTIRTTNADGLIYWVNVGANNDLRTGAALPTETWNQTLRNNAAGLGYRVVDWASVVASNPDLIADDGLGVHPNQEGRKIFAETVADAIESGGCGSIELSGVDNAQKVWNYMAAKGLQPYQIAGFMGNMQAEAGFEPRRLEYAWSDPPHLSYTVPPCANEKCQPGWGIVQWTAEGRKNALKAFMDSSGVVINESDPEEGNIEKLLGLQLEFVWVEINQIRLNKSTSISKYGNVTVLEGLQKTPTLEEATELITRNYEIPANMEAAIAKRIEFARAWLTLYGSGAPQQ